MRRIRALGGQTDSEDVPVVERDRETLPGAMSREEEAILIAERLAALVESRRAQGSLDAPVQAPPLAGPTPVVGARHSGRLLGNLLLTRGFIVETELQYALARQASTGDPIGQIVVDLGLISERDLIELIAEQLRMKTIDLDRVEVDREALSLLPKETARRLAVLALRRVDGQIDVAVGDPTDEAAVAELTRLLGPSLRLFLASRGDIEAAIDRLYR